MKKYLWILLLPVGFAVYSWSFSGYPILDRRIDILAQTDSACYVLMLRDFSLSQKYGDEYNTVHRSIGDVAQKHKSHHILYLIVANPIRAAFASLYHALGIRNDRAEYSVNAFIACINIGLLFYLMARHYGRREGAGIMAGFYAVALNTWILGSVPESWTLSPTLALIFLALFHGMRSRYLLLSLFVGLAMLNNIFLVSLLFFLIFEHAAKSRNLAEFAIRSALTGLVAVAAWAVSMTVLSAFDGSLGVENYFHYTLWFKQHIAPPIRYSDPYYWKVVVTHLFVNSVVSNQSDPGIPQEAIRYTLQQSPTGIAATAIYLILIVLACIGAAKLWAGEAKRTGMGRRILEWPGIPELAFCTIWVFMAVTMDPSGAFLYSTLVLPLVTILLHLALDLGRKATRVFVYATVLAILVNNAVQILKFRSALAVML